MSDLRNLLLRQIDECEREFERLTRSTSAGPDGINPEDRFRLENIEMRAIGSV